MKTFFLFTLAAVASAGYGTTGHYGNQYAHKGRSDHDHADHSYGYDSVKPDSMLKSGQGLTDNEARRDAVLPIVEQANLIRIDYLDMIKQKKLQRLTEIKTQNDREIRSPFEYQTRLLEKEEDDITTALTEAIQDSNDAFTDLLERMDDLYLDSISGMQEEVDQIIAAIERTEVDQKHACRVLHALRTDITKNIECTLDLAATTATYTTSSGEFAMYEGMFDNFHYDIGHGKGLGEGSIDNGKARDYGAVGDYEIDVGKKTRYARY